MDDTPSGGQTPWTRYAAWAAVGLMALVPAYYWLATSQVWEDGLITFRASHNLAMGHGFTYEPGTRVYSFTSPLNALALAFFDWLTKTDSFVVPLAWYNLLVIACAMGCAALMARLFRKEAQGRGASAVLFALALVLCVRVSAFMVNGQEAGFWLLFLAVSFGAVVQGAEAAWVALGVGWCGLMWTRPDSPVQVLLQSALILAFPLGTRAGQLRGLLKAGLLCALGYAPWFAWSWWYYGSPIPNSVQAKVGAYLNDFPPWKPIPLGNKVFDVLGGTFLPIYSVGGGIIGDVWIWLACACGLFLMALCLVPALSRLTRLAAFGLTGSLLYIAFLWSRGTAFPWYFVPPCFYAAILCARLPFEGGAPRLARWAACAVCLVIGAKGFVVGVRDGAEEQQRCAMIVRKPIGLWLRANVQPGQHVFLEPIGYIGYYSQASLYDYPGLVSPEVVRLRRQGLKFYQLIGALKPEWLVLRAHEMAPMEEIPSLANEYKLVAHFDDGGVRRGGDTNMYVLARAEVQVRHPVVPAR